MALRLLSWALALHCASALITAHRTWHSAGHRVGARSAARTAIGSGDRWHRSAAPAGPLFAVETATDLAAGPPVQPLGIGKDALLKKALGGDGAVYCTVPDDATVYDAVEVMNSANKGVALVMDKDSRVAGIFTERDFVTRVIEEGVSTKNVPIVDVMTEREFLFTMGPDGTVGEALKVMLERRFRHLPIMDGETVLGVVTIRELVKVMKEDDEMLGGAYPLASLPSWANPQSAGDYESQMRNRANVAARKFGPQDILRTGAVIVGAVIGTLLLQGNWVHEHEILTMSSIFALGYGGIILEEQFGYNKAALGLLMCAALWTTYAGAAGVTVAGALEELAHHVSEVSEIIFFLIGAMTIVEAVDAHNGFEIISEAIGKRDKKQLFWVVSVVSFFMSGILDNLTTTIVMASLLKKLVPDQDERKLFGALVVISANAGGAWTPIGDVTTTMLWINGQITALPTMVSLFLPSVVSTVVSTALLSKALDDGAAAPEALGAAAAPAGPKGVIVQSEAAVEEGGVAPRGKLVLATGVAGLLSVPVFKALTGLPPYLGMLSALGVMWVLTDTLHAGEGKEGNDELMVPAALRKIDTAGVLFFLGVLLSVASLESAGILQSIANFLDGTIGSNEPLLAGSIGAVSALIDNVPLVAASMGMYDLAAHPVDDKLWQLIAYCAGTGGSMLIIGSAAGVALMGLEKISFGWFAKKASLPAAAGYLAGIAAYLAQQQF